MADDVNDDILITRKGLDAVDELMCSDPNLTGEVREQVRNHLLQEHARLGDSKFRLLYSLRKPKNGGECLEVEYNDGKLTREEFLERLREYVARPADEEMLQKVVDELDSRLVRLGRFMYSVMEVGAFHRRDKVGKADRHMRAVCRPLNIFDSELETVPKFLKCARVRQRQPLVRIHGYSAPTAVELVLDVLMAAKTLWKGCKSSVRQGQADAQAAEWKSPEQLYWAAHSEEFPSVRDMKTLLHNELAIGLVELTEQSRQNPRPHSVEALDLNVHSSTINANVVSAGRSVSTATQTKPEPLLKVTNWSDLALGIDEKRQVWAISPPPTDGAVFPKKKASHIRMRRGMGLDLLEILADSDSGRSAQIGLVASKLGLQPPSASMPGDGRARGDALRSEYESDLSSKGSLWRRSLNSALAEVARRLRKSISGPVGPANSALSMDDKNVNSGFVVRHLHQDANRHLRFGQPPVS